MQLGLQFLEVHVSIQSVADVVCIEGLIGHSVSDRLTDVFADAHAQFAVAIARIDCSAVLKGSLPLGWTRDACVLQRYDLRHGIIVADKNLHRRTRSGGIGSPGGRPIAVPGSIHGDDYHSTMRVIDEALIAEAGRRLAAAAPNAQVVLFGSHARGDAHPHSNVDFFVVEPKVGNEAEESVRLHRTLRDLRMPADVVVVSRDYADRWREVRGGLVHAALSQGRVLAG